MRPRARRDIGRSITVPAKRPQYQQCRRPPIACIADRSKLSDLTARNQRARVAKLADAPDLGLRNHRFHDIALRFKMKRLYEREMPILEWTRDSTNGEQNDA